LTYWTCRNCLQCCEQNFPHVQLTENSIIRYQHSHMPQYLFSSSHPSCDHNAVQIIFRTVCISVYAFNEA
jgi:hypothetical protein